MNVVLVFAAVAVVLFVFSFWSKRRFGLLGLSLAAGSVLANLWLNDASMLLGALGIFPRGNVTNGITLSIITVLPAIVLMFHGHKYKDIISHVVGSVFFAVLGLAFLVGPIGTAMLGATASGPGSQFYHWLVTYNGLIISLGLVLAVVDLVFTRMGKMSEKHGRR